MMRASDVSPRMFDNDFVDFFSRTHWASIPVVFLPIAAVAFGVSVSQGVSLLITLPAFAVGFVLWTLTEYWLHRTAFHWTPNTSWGPRFHFLMHGVHHTHHRDPYRLVMPPAVGLTLAVVFFGMFWGLGQLGASLAIHPGWYLGAYSGFVVGYVTYDCTHYYLHHARPTSSRMKRLRAHHNNHHHNHTDTKFGVSTTVWDRVFGTL